MALFATLFGRALDGVRRDLVPGGFEALADALDGENSLISVALEIGRRTARDGASLDDVLANLRTTYQCILDGVEPPFEVTRALSGAWADASLSYLHAISCEDPLTGLASLAHVRTRIIEIYREAARVGTQGPPAHALLVVEIRWSDSSSARLDRLLQMIDVAEIVRSFYTGDETVGQLNGSRAVAVIRRDDRIFDSMGNLLSLLRRWEAKTGVGTRLWIEGLPASASSAEILLDELAR